MEGAIQLLAHGGMMPQYPLPEGDGISPRKRGVKQGALLMLIGAVLVPVLGVMASFAPDRLGNVFAFFCALSAVICFLGGPLRMLFAAIFEQGAPAPYQFMPTQSYAPASMPPPVARASALPPSSVNPASHWTPRPQTAEILQPSSVTDHTTQLLEKPEPEGD